MTDPLVIGDSYDFAYTVANVPAGQSVVSGFLSVKLRPSDSDNDALIFNNIGTVLSESGWITISGIYTLVTFTLNSTQTRNLNARTEYYYDAVIVTDAGKVKTLEVSSFIPIQDVTRSP